eukprot:5766410-Pleurochrysis_carterae.AAC.1
MEGIRARAWDNTQKIGREEASSGKAAMAAPGSGGVDGGSGGPSDHAPQCPSTRALITPGGSQYFCGDRRGAAAFSRLSRHKRVQASERQLQLAKLAAEYTKAMADFVKNLARK